MFRSISEYDHNNPLTERNTRQRGQSETTKNVAKGNILFKLGNLDDALKKAQFLLENKPKDENYLYLKGRVLEKLDRNWEAEKWFKEALDINPKFSQAAFYLAAIENKRGNFEKSIEMYNYALSKDQIPKSGAKGSTPFVSVDIGVACDNTIKANISGRTNQLTSNLQSLNSVNIRDIRKNFETRTAQRSQPSGTSSTNLPTTVKDEGRYVNREYRQSEYDAWSDSSHHSHTKKLPDSVELIQQTPILNKKKLRKVWRAGKSGVITKNFHADAEIVKDYPQAFYSVGNSIGNGESLSIPSSHQITSKLPSSHDTKSTIIKKKIKKKNKTQKVDFLNFSDRTLSSKLYSVKRKEIHLYNKNKSVINNWGRHTLDSLHSLVLDYHNLII